MSRGGAIIVYCPVSVKKNSGGIVVDGWTKRSREMREKKNETASSPIVIHEKTKSQFVEKTLDLSWNANEMK